MPDSSQIVAALLEDGLEDAEFDLSADDLDSGFREVLFDAVPARLMAESRYAKDAPESASRSAFANRFGKVRLSDASGLLNSLNRHMLNLLLLTIEETPYLQIGINVVEDVEYYSRGRIHLGAVIRATRPALAETLKENGIDPALLNTVNPLTHTLVVYFMKSDLKKALNIHES